ncbi:MAG: hypothetical protein GY913_34360 [Proteobacteria bacterium]|nr:hypothetical protein [Pseudomonadota bacterium]MCP4922013.1 hypothetical protein [Pseudomonadota bacterium]
MDSRDQEREERRAAATTEKRKGALRTLLIALLVGLSSVYAIYWLSSRPEPTPDLAEQYDDVLPWASLKEVNGIWVGTPLPDWDGMDDPKAAEKACNEMLERVELSGSGSVTVQHPETGVTIAECGLQ